VRDVDILYAPIATLAVLAFLMIAWQLINSGPRRSWHSFLVCGAGLIGIAGVAMLWWKAISVRTVVQEQYIYDQCLMVRDESTVRCDAMLQVLDRL
jgi:hypothetical protein